eukprot:CAMPEP_0119494490 /NCGR_PEP_ID=MMETSP1344-20130328/18421_1 /TAXON_ID=236787 /ORGANISM="Florenciella parvula, Strain CCMP2471" /LENGTH=127 /DNA_ID=CAMNT_0007529995 /DNA_START=140 /DNA_END=523 /DNA_ORIENTATION=-
MRANVTRQPKQDGAWARDYCRGSLRSEVRYAPSIRSRNSFALTCRPRAALLAPPVPLPTFSPELPACRERTAPAASASFATCPAGGSPCPSFPMHTTWPGGSLPLPLANRPHKWGCASTQPPASSEA